MRARLADVSFPALKDARKGYKFLKTSSFWKFLTDYDELSFSFKFFPCFFLVYSSAALGFYFSH